jgi:hypothetical protein
MRSVAALLTCVAGLEAAAVPSNIRVDVMVDLLWPVVLNPVREEWISCRSSILLCVVKSDLL